MGRVRGVALCRRRICGVGRGRGDARGRGVSSLGASLGRRRRELCGLRVVFAARGGVGGGEGLVGEGHSVGGLVCCVCLFVGGEEEEEVGR